MWAWLAQFVVGLFAPSANELIDKASTWANNEISALVAEEPSWAQQPTKLIGQALINAGTNAIDALLGLPPEQVAAVVTHAAMNHPAVVAANPATLTGAGGATISPAAPAKS